jgi:4-amino-4-deoxy-L-arabinose transferase-like glycosyltransferase
LLLLALAKTALHFATIANYGYFRDELYYLACADHLAWGYVDHPPFSIAVLAATRYLLGDSLLAIRLPVVLAGAATVVLTGWLARELGGGRFAQLLAALAFVFMPIALGLATFYSMNAFDLLFWVGAVYVLVRIINSGDARLWVAFGAIVGLGIMNKISVGFLVFGLLVGLALTSQRRLLVSAWFSLGGVIAGLLFLPHIIWQIANGFPTIEFMRNASELKIQAMPVGAYLGAQVFYTSPAAVPIWVGGLAYLLFVRSAAAYRALGIAYVAILALLVAQHGKAYYLAPAYPMLFAAGGVAYERLSAGRGWRWVRPALVGLVTVVGLVLLPMAVPILPPESVVRYATAIGIQAPQEERQQRVALPQHFADRFGWENMVATVARVYQALPAEDRARTAIVASNYGEAGAIDFFGRRYGLPHAISPHNNYWLWGPGDITGEVAIVIGAPRQQIEILFEDVTQAATVESEYAVAYETNLPVYVCRHLKRPLAEVWPALKRYI